MWRETRQWIPTGGREAVMRRRLQSPLPPFDQVPAAVVDAAKRLFDLATWTPTGSTALSGLDPSVAEGP